MRRPGGCSAGWPASSTSRSEAVRVVVIGGTGHIGGYLVPRLVARGHDVVVLSRGQSAAYRAHPAWDRVERLTVDREAEDAAGTFSPRIAALDADAVVDLICFTPESAGQLVDALRGTGTHLVHCGTIWVHGPAVEVPVTEETPRRRRGADHPRRQPRPRRLRAPRPRRRGPAAEPRARDAPPRPRRRRGAGLRAGARPPWRRARRELP